MPTTAIVPIATIITAESWNPTPNYFVEQQEVLPMSDTKVTTSLWHYHCPECGISDGETGHHASVDLIWCEVCLEEKRHVRLKRWPVEEDVRPASE